jgi:trimeric autotransporter adhesin
MSLTKVINTGIKNAEITGSKINTSSSFSFDVLQANTLTVTNEFQSNSVNSAFNTANAASSYANSAFIHANSAYTEANLKFNSSGGLISGDVTISGNIVPTTDVTYNIGNSSNRIHTIFVGPGSVDIDGIILSNNNGLLTVSGASDFSVQGLPTVSDTSDKINLVFDSANSASSYANGSFAVANVADQRAVTSGVYANAAYLQANTPSQVANAASSYANGSFSAANVADQRAVTSGVYANSAYAEANVRATTTYVDNAVANLVNSAPSTLDTLNELATALNNDPDFATTIATNIGIIGTYANAAYLQANTPSQVANSAGVYANAAYGQANTANILAQFSFDSSNLNSSDIIIVGDYANSAFSEANAAWQKAFEVEDYAINVNYHAVSSFNQANTADQKAVTSGDYANSAFLVANTPSQVANSASSYANGSFAAANVADQKAVTSGDYANSAFNTANNATDSWVRDAANSASSYANSGYSLANTANTLAQSAYDAANNATDSWVRDAANSASSYANSGYSLANTANITAQAAFDAANNAVDTWVRDAANSASSYANSGFDKANTANTLAQSAYDEANTKYSSDGGTISGDVLITGNLNITGNTITHSANDFIINDPIVLLANNNPGNLLDVGFVAHYIEESTTKHTGLVKDVSDDKWYLFENYTPHIQETNILDKNDASLVISTLKANLESESVLIRGQDPLNSANSASIYANAAFDAANNAVDTWVRDAANSASSYANSAYLQANTPSEIANLASSYANSGFSLANTANTLAQAAYDAANNAVDTWVRDAANSASDYANSAFLQANTPSQTSNSASDYANGAFSQANTANTLAQAAYDQANTGGAGGSGLFNGAINTSVGYAVTSTLSSAVTFSANAIVHSIYLTNISSDSTGNVQVLGDFTPSGSSNVSIFYKIPLPYRSSVEMLKRPQVVKENDILKLQSFEDDVPASTNAHAIIVYETTDSADYERVGKLVTDAYSNMYTSTSNPSVVESIKLVNQDSAYGNHAVTVVWTNSANTLQGYFTKELILPANSTIELCETPKYMSAGDKFDAWATTTDVISIFVSAKKII